MQSVSDWHGRESAAPRGGPGPTVSKLYHFSKTYCKFTGSDEAFPFEIEICSEVIIADSGWTTAFTTSTSLIVVRSRS